MSPHAPTDCGLIQDNSDRAVLAETLIFICRGGWRSALHASAKSLLVDDLKIVFRSAGEPEITKRRRQTLFSPAFPRARWWQRAVKLLHTMGLFGLLVSNCTIVRRTARPQIEKRRGWEWNCEWSAFSSGKTPESVQGRGAIRYVGVITFAFSRPMSFITFCFAPC